MSNEVTIDELRIEIEAESGTAADNLDNLAKSLDRLQAVTQRMTGGGDGLNKVAKQIEKLNAISQKIQSMRGFEKLGEVVNQLSKLDRLSNVGDISGFVRNLNKLPQAVNALAQMPSIDTAKFQQIADALKPLETVSAGNLNSLLNSLRKLPKASQELAGVDLTRFASQIDQISRAIEPIVRQAERGGAGLTALAQIMQQTNRTARQSSSGVSLFNQTIGNIKVKTLAAIAGLRRLFSELKKGVTASAAYVENLNLFSVTMGDSAAEALKFAEAVNDALGVDTSDWIRYQGVFQSIGKGFGIASEKADVMSKNLTQLTYDISSFYNISTDMAGEKLQSALSGQVMPMRQLGFAIEETTLKQVALNHGIKTSVENMTQAQKAQLRYIAIMEQAGNIGVLGDMARTIDTAANGMRVFTARLQQFARAVGNMVMPVLSAVLPYATAFVQVITEAAQSIANFFGFELPKIDFSGASVSSGFDDITSSVDDATKANEKFKGSLSSIDQLNIIGSKDEGKSSAGNENQFDLGIELPEYDFLQGVESKTKQIAENIKAWFKEALPWIEAVGSAIAGAFAFSKISKFTDGIKNIATIFGKDIGTDKLKGFSKTLGGIVGGLAAGASSGILLNSGIKNLITGTGKLGGNIAKVASGAVIAGGAIATFVKLGNPVGAVITGIGAAIGLLSGVIAGNIEHIKKYNEELNNTITYADNGGISIKGLTDGFKGYFNSITNGYDDILENTAAFKDNEEKIKNATTEVGNLVDKYTLLDKTITADDAQTIADNVKIIGDGIQTNLGTATQGIVDTLKTTFHDFAVGLGKDVDDMVTKFYLLENMGNTALASTRQHADELVASLQTGNLNVDEQKKTFEELENTIKAMGTSDVGTKEQMNFERAIQEMSTAKINFDKPEEVEKQITELTSLADQARSSIMTAYEDQSFELKQMKQRYETMINLKTGNTVKYDFDIAMGKGSFDRLFADQQEILDKAKEGNLAKIDTGQAVNLIMLQNQLAENKQNYIDTKYADKGASFKGGWNAWWSNGLFISPEEVEAETKAGYGEEYEKLNSKIYDLIGSSLKGLNLTPEAMDAGKMITEGLANGTINGQEDLNNAIDSVAFGGLDKLRKDFLIESPSKKTKEIGDYLMQGLDIGIMNGLPDVLKTIDNVSAAIFNKTKGLSFSIPAFNAENAAVNMDMNDIYERVKKETASFNNSYTLPAGTAAIGGAVGAAREAFPNAAQAAAANSDAVSDININLQSFVEIDGEQVGQAVSQYQQRQMAYSNGQ